MRQNDSPSRTNVSCNELDADTAQVPTATQAGAVRQSKSIFMQWLFAAPPQNSLTMDVAMHTAIHGRDFTVNASLPGRPSNLVNRRRSQRVLLTVRLEVSGKRLNKTSFEEETRTIIVNSHGALLNLKESVITGQLLSLKNDATNETINCTVVDIFSGQDGVPEVAIEFCEPCPRFWRVTFPPADWSMRSPEAKKYAEASKPIDEPLLKK
jgi:hypothetical protein